MMVRLYTPNGYCVSLIQTTLGNGTALEAVYWARDIPQEVWLPCPIEEFDMNFMYAEHFMQLMKAILELPVKEMLYP